jgi:glutaredoxin
MPLQNRVSPFGEIVATADRGRFTGNRGIIHDPVTRTLLNRRWSSKAWITCVCEFRGRRRKVMSRRSWTELFFLDEATSLAAGHRPCFYCRRDDATAFRDAWATGNRRDKPYATEMDAVLHEERLENRVKRLHSLRTPALKLPDGAMITSGGKSYLIASGKAWLWSFAGYSRARADIADAKLLTPPSIVNALREGYPVQIDSSALDSIFARPRESGDPGL